MSFCNERSIGFEARNFKLLRYTSYFALLGFRTQGRNYAICVFVYLCIICCMFCFSYPCLICCYDCCLCVAGFGFHLVWLYSLNGEQIYTMKQHCWFGEQSKVWLHCRTCVQHSYMRLTMASMVLPSGNLLDIAALCRKSCAANNYCFWFWKLRS